MAHCEQWALLGHVTVVGDLLEEGRDSSLLVGTGGRL